MRLALVLILLSTTVYSQNIFRFKVKGTRVKVERTITTRQTDLARRILTQKTNLIKQKQLRATYYQQRVHPMGVTGPNNYLKGLSRRFTGQQWGKITKSGGYNGAHHLVTKAVIKQITGKDGEIVANAPSVFHPLHNNPNFITMFHDHERQLRIYEQSGIRGIIIDFFERANAVSDRLGLPLYNDEVIHQALLEAELWAKHWNLKWE